jgi:membrane protease YdiL (CAAX protease family)
MTTSDPTRLRWTTRVLVLYFVLAFVITWAILIPALRITPPDYELLFIILAAFGPFASAIIVIRTNFGGGELRRWLGQIFTWRVPLMLYLAGAFFIPIGIGGLQFLLYLLLGGKPDFSEAIPWYLYLLYLIPTALLSGGNEEPGWRGLALPALLERFHPVLAALILGTIHAAWHLPLMGHYDTNFGWYLFNLLPLTVLLSWFYLKSRGSVIPVMLLHAGTNVIGSFIPTPEDVLGGQVDFMLLRGVVYWGIAIVLLIITRGRLGCGRLPEDPVQLKAGLAETEGEISLS